MRETVHSEVVLPECPPTALEAVLRFCYMGECRLPRRDMLDLLVLADRLDIPDLTSLAEKVGRSCCSSSHGFEDNEIEIVYWKCSLSVGH